MSWRRFGLIASAAVWLSCSARFSGIPDSNTAPDAPPVDNAAPDAGLGAWGPAMPVMGAATTQSEDDVTLSSSANELIFSLAISATDKDLYVMKRSSTSAPFGARVELTTLNTVGIEGTPRLSADDLTLYFGRDGAIHKSTRTSKTAAWGAPTAVAGIPTPARWYSPCGTTRFMVVVTTTNSDLYEGTVGGTPTPVAELNTDKTETSPFLSPDCLTLYFASSRSGVVKIYKSTRASISGPWSIPELLPSPINDSVGLDEDPWISADQRLFVWASKRNASTTFDLYMSTR